MENPDKIVIFGTGSVAEKLYSLIDFEKVEIVAFVNSRSIIKEFHGIKVIMENELKCLDYDYILIGSGYVETINKKLLEHGVSADKIVSYIFDDPETYQSATTFLSYYFEKKYNRSKMKKWIKDEINISEFYPSVFWDHENAITCLNKDFVREQTMKLIARRIKENGVKGSIAELGVYKGDFTVILDRLFPDKKLYLFDTFEGFLTADIESDQSVENKFGEQEKFKDTSVDYVLNRLNSKEIIIKKGYFPDTFDLQYESFCFVSIDLNLSDPVYSALNIFYPLMEKGGYILVSDYYAPFYQGTKSAVDRFCKEKGIFLFPVADFYGSALFCKQ